MSNNLIPEPYSPSALWLYYERSQAALIALKDKLDSGTNISSFSSLTQDQIIDVLESMREELDDQVTASLIGSFEAIIRVDFQRRVDRRIKGGPRQEFSTLHEQYSRAVPFEKILDAWTQHGGGKQITSQLKQLYIQIQALVGSWPLLVEKKWVEGG